MSTIATIVARLIEAGADPAATAVCVVEAFELGRLSADMSAGLSSGQQDIQRDKWREQKRAYRKNRNKTNAATEANDAAATVATSAPSADMSSNCPADMQDNHCEPILSFFSENGIREGRKKGSTESEGVAPARRGTRLSADSPLSDTDRQFAINAGCRDPDAAWAEFIDYWISVPGQRGTKLDWSATWRNRVRDRYSNTGAGNGRSRLSPPSKPSLGDRARELADEARRRELAAGIGRSGGTVDRY